MPPRKRQNIEETPDPFADEAQTENHSEDQTPPWEVEGNETEVKTTDEAPKENKTVIEFGGGDRLSVTLKQHKGYEASWIVLKGDTPADVLTTMQDENFNKLMDWTKRASEKFQEGSAPASGGGNTSQASSGSQNGSQARTQGRPSGATEHPQGKKMFCEHGQRAYKSGFSAKTQKTWGAFDCPEAVCDREWDK